MDLLHGKWQPIPNSVQLLFIFPFQSISKGLQLPHSYFSGGGLYHFKGTLAQMRRPDANKPHLGETVRCSPSKHKHQLVTHSKQRWSMRDDRPTLHTGGGSQLLSKSHFLIVTDFLPTTRKSLLNS